MKCGLQSLSLILSILLLAGGIALVVSSTFIPRQRATPTPFHQADYPLCIRVIPGPLIQPKKPVLYPNNSEKV